MLGAAVLELGFHQCSRADSYLERLIKSDQLGTELQAGNNLFPTEEKGPFYRDSEHMSVTAQSSRLNLGSTTCP